MTQTFEIFGKDGNMQPVNNSTLQIGQIIWLNGYGQSEYSHDRKAIYKIKKTNWGTIYYWVNLDKPERGQSDFVKPASKLFGIGMYYNEGETATGEEITNALADAQNEEKNKETVKQAADIAYSEFMKPWGDYSNLPSATINRTWFKNMMRKGALLVKCDGKYTDDYALDYANDYSVDKFYKDAGTEYFNDWKLSRISIWGNKEGLINVSFASCEHYTFLVKPEFLPNAKPHTAIEATTTPEPVNPKFEVVEYSEKAIAVFGDTKKIKDELKAIGGKFNPYLTKEGVKCAGWIFSKTKRDELNRILAA